MTRLILVVLLVALVGISTAPTTAAAAPCVVGASEGECAVSVQLRECVTDPCDTMDVCVAYGRVCVV